MRSHKKLNLFVQTRIPHHTGGWNYVLKILNKFHSNEGTLTYDIADMTFGNDYEYNVNHKIIPIKKPWIGFFHHPLNIVPWYWRSYQLKPIVMISSSEFMQSLDYCKGIFTLSKSMADWYKDKLPNIKVNSLYHPTRLTKKLFNLAYFLSNPKPNLINIGFFLRKLTTIFLLDCDQYEKVILANPLIYDNLYKEMMYYKYDLDFSRVKFKNFVSSSEYDDLLSQSIVFLDLFDSCANNIILECIIRNTPLLVNKLESVVEYLGKDYPFYYSSIKEASSKLSNRDLIIATHKYLCQLEIKNKIKADYFEKSLCNSDIFINL